MFFIFISLSETIVYLVFLNISCSRNHVLIAFQKLSFTMHPAGAKKVEWVILHLVVTSTLVTPSVFQNDGYQDSSIIDSCLKLLFCDNCIWCYTIDLLPSSLAQNSMPKFCHMWCPRVKKIILNIKMIQEIGTQDFHVMSLVICQIWVTHLHILLNIALHWCLKSVGSVVYLWCGDPDQWWLWYSAPCWS